MRIPCNVAGLLDTEEAMKTRLAIASVLLGFGGACAANAGLIDVAFYNSGYSPGQPIRGPAWRSRPGAGRRPVECD